MSDVVTSAWITAAIGFFGLMIGSFKNEILQIFQRSKTRSVHGSWNGDACDIEVPNDLIYEKIKNYQLELKLIQRGKNISGETLINSNGNSDTHKVFGEIFSDEHIHVNYSMNRKGTVHSGACLLSLNGLGNELNGFYLAKRTQEKGYVFGKMTLKKCI